MEAGTGEHYPCNSRFSGGILHAAYQDIMLPPGELMERMECSGLSDRPQAQAIADDAARAFMWLRAHGAKVAHFPHLKRGAWVLAPPRPMVTGLLGGAAWLGRGPDLALRSLRAAATRRDCLFLEGTRGQDILMEDGRCSGILALGPQGRLRIDAPAVVLADGGFSGNPELFRKHIGPAPEKVVQRGAGTGRGDALRMGLAIGAGTSALDRFYGHLLSVDALSNDRLWPYPQIDALAGAGLMVDRGGRRFLDEGLGGIHASNVLASLPEPDGATVILDSAIWKGLGRIGLVAPDPLLKKHGGTVFEAADIPTLARMAKLDEYTLAQTVDGYNAALRASAPHRLQPPRSVAKAAALPIARPPFMAIPVCSGITNTMGGLQVDAHGRVLDTQQHPIPGIYAAGAATGGLEGGPTVHYVGGLMKALVFGIRAAEHAAQRLSTIASRSQKETHPC
jgi:fumarate reductase flavoprotein subunit